MEIKKLKCMGCGSVGTLRKYEYLDGRGDSAQFKLATEENLQGFTRFVCCNCYLTQSYWFGAEDLLEEEKKYMSVKNEFDKIVDEANEFRLDARAWMSDLYADLISALEKKLGMDNLIKELEELEAESKDENITVKRYNELSSLIDSKKEELELAKEKSSTLNELRYKRDNISKLEKAFTAEPIYFDENDHELKINRRLCYINSIETGNEELDYIANKAREFVMYSGRQNAADERRLSILPKFKLIDLAYIFVSVSAYKGYNEFLHYIGTKEQLLENVYRKFGIYLDGVLDEHYAKLDSIKPKKFVFKINE